MEATPLSPRCYSIIKSIICRPSLSPTVNRSLNQRYEAPTFPHCCLVNKSKVWRPLFYSLIITGSKSTAWETSYPQVGRWQMINLALIQPHFLWFSFEDFCNDWFSCRNYVCFAALLFSKLEKQQRSDV